MSKKIIRFRGLTLNRDEQAVEPGELALCGNVEMYDGALRPSVLKGTSLASGNALTGTLFFIHKTSSYTNFITKYQDEHDVWYMDYYYEEDVAGTSNKRWSGGHISWSSPFSPGDILSVNSVGNTLCMLTQSGLFYFLFKKENGTPGYKYLGQHPPFVELQFNLHSDNIIDDDNKVLHEFKTDGDWTDNITTAGIWPIKEEQRSVITEQVLAEINKRLADVTAGGYFYAPFFVRYVYHMFDNKSYIMHSPPVLLSPLLDHPVMTFLNGIHTDGENPYCIYIRKSGLQMQCVDVSVIQSLEEWGDVIKSVDVFVTPQISRIDTSKLISTCSHNYGDLNRTLIDGDFSIDVGSNYMNTYSEYSILNPYGFDLPEYGEDEHLTHIKNSASFYLLRSYSISELRNLFNGQSQTFKDVEFDGSRLAAITTQRQLTDDYKTHNLLAAVDTNASLYVYNHRLHVYGIGEHLFKGFSAWTMFPYMGNGDRTVTKIQVWINTGDDVIIEQNTFSDCPAYIYFLMHWYVFYPDDRATHMKIFYQYNGTEFFEIHLLEPCSFLNGAFSMTNDMSAIELPSGVPPHLVPMVNKVYTSKSDNPFYFPNLPGESGINTVGTGNIIGMAAITRALSQGQVGDHDLAVFASDGIWVGKVNDQGTYSDFHNLSREICVNKYSICQLDQSVIFATDRALNQFYESDVINISEVLDGPIRSFATLLSDIRASDSVAKALIDFGTPAITLFKQGRVLYDYTGSRLIVFPENTSLSGVCLVYSIRDKAWSTMAIPGIRAVLPGYPCPYVQYYATDDDMPTTDNQHGPVQCLDTPYTYDTQSTAVSGIIMSRTLTFSDTMDVIRGFRQMNDCATMPTIYFFGSNNQRDWQQIGYSARGFHNYMPGHPFRFFRFAIYMQMHTDEKYQEVLLEIINKYAKL